MDKTIEAYRRGLTPALRRAVTAKTSRGLNQFVREWYPGIFTFDAFTPRFCSEILAEMLRRPSTAPNSMNKYGVVLEDAGLAP